MRFAALPVTVRGGVAGKRHLLAAGIGAGAVALLGPSVADAASGLPGREAEAVVLTGARLPSLTGAAPRRVVGFRRARGRWQQVPVQVDERAMIDYNLMRQQRRTEPFLQLAYADSDTWAGADPDPTFDDDDELAAMAKDAGDAAGRARAPRGVRVGTRTVVRVTDPLRAGRTQHLYLWVAKRAMDPGAGRRYVDYDVRLLSGPVKATYDYKGVANDGNGPPNNLERSTVKTRYYFQRLRSRWIQDQLRIRAGRASGRDILDGDKVQVGPSCGRTEVTFSRGGGGFIANISGPVRAIRSYIGANSGTYTQRDHVYYERSEVTTTTLRVHAGITGITQFYDWSSAAVGMRYRNSRNVAGVRVDGEPDKVDEGPTTWEQVSGSQGSVTTITRVASDFPGIARTTYYLDDSTSPPVKQCPGYADAAAIGSSGPMLRTNGANSDPTQGTANRLAATRTTFFGPPRQQAADAARHARQVDRPLRVSTSRHR